VVGLGAAAGDQLVADAPGERDVRDRVPVQVAELAAAEHELDAAESVRRNGDARPREDLVGDALGAGDRGASSHCWSDQLYSPR
jgi:hypothetical protein